MRVKNVRYMPGGGAEIVEVEVDDPGPGQVQVEVAASESALGTSRHSAAVQTRPTRPRRGMRASATSPSWVPA